MKHSDPNSLAFGTRAIHAGQHADPATGAIMTPIYQTSTYIQPSPGVFIEPYDYSRSANPTRNTLEANLASLEGAKHGLSFASGCAAMACVLATLNTSDHIVISDDVYGGSFRLLDKVYAQKVGLKYTVVDMTDHAAVEAAFQDDTKLLWVETPSNPMLKVIDIQAVCTIAKNKGVTSVVDNTFATPYLQNPLAHGADIVMHSVTKYIGGHSDVIGGALMTNSDKLEQDLRFMQNSVGGVPSPQDCFYLLRSTKTLHVRMQRHCENAMAVAKHLQQHPAVERVIYPGLDSHPQHDIAKKQMRDFGGMISVVLKGGLEPAKKMLEKVQIFTLAESLGGVESLIEHPAIMTHAAIPAEQRAKLGIDDGLVRLSVGIEDINDLLADLNQALS